MANNKVIFGNETIMDITDSTVTPETLKQGEVAYNSAGQRIVGTLVTIGHKILDAFGNLMPNRENLQFTDAHTTDDSQGNATKVEIAKQVTSQEWENATEKGFYLIGDDDDYLLDISQVRNANAEHIPYSDTKNAKQKIDEVDGKRISFTQIYFGLDLPTIVTSYKCDWSSYDALSLEIDFYGNVREQITIPTSYFNQTSSGQRPQLFDAPNQYGVDIYKNTNNSIYIKANKQSSTLGVRIYGIKLG